MVDKYIHDPAMSLAVSEEHPQPLLSCADDSATVATPGIKLAVDVDVFSGEDVLEAYVRTEEQFRQDVCHDAPSFLDQLSHLARKNVVSEI